jgi:[ribosomal protein S5]-alanine N-acetyltransferase
MLFCSVGSRYFANEQAGGNIMIETERLQLVSFKSSYAQAVLKGRSHLERLFPYAISPQWPNANYSLLLPIIALDVLNHPFKQQWNRFIVHKKQRLLVGQISCYEYPDQKDHVEIGYGVVTDYRGYGYGSEVVKAFISWLFSHEHIHTIVAECVIENKASARVLEKCGFCNTSNSGERTYWELIRQKRNVKSC